MWNCRRTRAIFASTTTTTTTPRSTHTIGSIAINHQIWLIATQLIIARRVHYDPLRASKNKPHDASGSEVGVSFTDTSSSLALDLGGPTLMIRSSELLGVSPWDLSTGRHGGASGGGGGDTSQP